MQKKWNMSVNRMARQRPCSSKISRIFYQSWDRPLPHQIARQNKSHIPEDYVYKLFSLQDAREYLQTNWGTQHLDLFDRYERIAHKVDLWRYCILFETGGIYMDADCVLLSDIDKLINANDMIFVTNERGAHDIFNGFLATYPRNPIFERMIEYMLHVGISCQEDYYYNCRYLYQVVCGYINVDLHRQSYITNPPGTARRLCLLIDRYVNRITVASSGKDGSSVSHIKYPYLNWTLDSAVACKEQEMDWVEYDCFVAYYQGTPVLIECNHLYPYSNEYAV